MRIFFVVIGLLMFQYGCSDDRINLTEILPEIMETNPQTEGLPEIPETEPQANVIYLTFRKGSQPIPNAHGLAPKNNYLEWSDTRFQVWANGDNTNMRGDPLRIGGVIFSRGLAAHVRSQIVYSLRDRKYNSFEAWVGIADYQDYDITNIPCGHGGSVQFFFKIDGVIVHQTERVNAIDLDALAKGEGLVKLSPLRVAFDIPPNASELEITVTDSGDGTCSDHWIMGDAKLISDDPIKFTEAPPEIMEANPQTEVSPEIIETDPQTNVTYLTFRKGSQPSPNIHGLSPKNSYLEWSDTRFQVWANGDNTTLRGTPLEIGGTIFQRGISAHPHSRIVYSLQDRYNRFEAWVGVPDYQDGDMNHIPCGHGGSVQFFFKIDGIIVQHTERIGAIDMDALVRGEGVVNVPPLHVAFDIPPNASGLEIIVTDSGDGDCGDNWIIGDAKLISDN